MSIPFKKIGEFESGETVYGNYLVKSIKTDFTVKKKLFMDIEIGDKTGSLIAKLWDVTIHAEKLKVGDVVYATGTVNEWQGAFQLKVDHIEKAQNAPDVSEFVPSAPFSSTQMDEMIAVYIDHIGDPEVKDIVVDIYETHREQFLEAPAAFGMHHAIYGGLAYHVVTMLKSAEKLMEVYRFLDKDLMYAGIILHDIAKVLEMEYQDGSASAYTRPGFLLGHIVQGTLLIESAAERTGASVRTKEVLQHLVVSHHDKGEWGSPMPPKMPEAIMIHFIDNIDAKMYMAKELLNGKRDGEYTDYHKGIRTKLLAF